MNTTLRVCGYTRVSSNIQVEGHGFERQEEAIQAFVAGHKSLELLKTYREEAVSGTVEGLDRPALVDLLEFVEQERDAGREVHGIVIERMDRLARELMVSEALIASLRKRSLQLFSADQGALIDLVATDIDPMRKAIRQIMGVLAELDKSMLVLKLTKAKDRIRRETGRCGGAMPFGSKPEEESLHRIIFDRRADGWSYRQIAEQLASLGTPGKWTKDIVRGILRHGTPPAPPAPEPALVPA